MTSNNTPAPRRVQSPEDTLARMAGVPRTPDEVAADRQALEEERTLQAQKMAGVAPGQQPPQPAGPAHPTRDHEREKDQREKA